MIPATSVLDNVELNCQPWSGESLFSFSLDYLFTNYVFLATLHN
jgi:hypothetical protein